MSISKTIHRYKRYAVLLFFPLVASLAMAGYYGGGTKNHGHTSTAGDGGPLTNPIITGTGTFTGVNVTTIAVSGTGTIQKAVVSSLTVSNFINTNINGDSIGNLRNKLINGEMVFNQRYESVAVTPTISGINFSPSYTLDHWGTIQSSANFTVSRVLDAPTGFTYSMKVLCSSASLLQPADYWAVVEQPIETQYLRDVNYGSGTAKTLTAQFWVKSNYSGPKDLSIFLANSTMSFTRLITIDNQDTWEKKSVTFPGNTGTNLISTSPYNCLMFGFDFGSGSNRQVTPGSWTANSSTKTHANTASTTWGGLVGMYVQISGVELKIETNPSDFNYRPYDQELSLCRRYYEKSYQVGVSSVGAAVGTNQYLMTTGDIGSPQQAGWLKFSVSKRIPPTMTFYSPTGTPNVWLWYDATGVGSQRTTTATSAGTEGTGITQTLSTDPTAIGHWAADADY